MKTVWLVHVAIIGQWLTKVGKVICQFDNDIQPLTSSLLAGVKLGFNKTFTWG